MRLREGRTFSQADGKGTPPGASPGPAITTPPAIMIENPTPDRVLLFEGEEVLGAQQNRTFDLSALIAAGQRVETAVSCVEQGRWDGRRADEVHDRAYELACRRLDESALV